MMCVIAICGFAGNKYVYVKSNNANVRAKAISSGRVLMKVGRDLYPMYGSSGAWYRVEAGDVIDWVAGYINKSVCIAVEDTGFGKTESKNTYSIVGDGFTGNLVFSPGTQGMLKYKFSVKKGAKVINSGSGETELTSEGLSQVYDHGYGGCAPVVYDANTGLLFFAGYLWKKN